MKLATSVLKVAGDATTVLTSIFVASSFLNFHIVGDSFFYFLLLEAYSPKW